MDPDPDPRVVTVVDLVMMRGSGEERGFEVEECGSVCVW